MSTSSVIWFLKAKPLPAKINNENFFHYYNCLLEFNSLLRPKLSIPGSLDCSFGNLVTLIGHRNFSLLGMHQNCAIFYILGDSIKSDSKIDLSEIDGSSRQCRKAQPLFYKHNDGTRIMNSGHFYPKISLSHFFLAGQWTMI